MITRKTRTNGDTVICRDTITLKGENVRVELTPDPTGVMAALGETLTFTVTGVTHLQPAEAEAV